MRKVYKNIIAVAVVALLSGCSSINFDRGVSPTDAEIRAMEVVEIMPAELWEDVAVKDTETVEVVETTNFPIPKMKPDSGDGFPIPKPKPIWNVAVDAYTAIEIADAKPVEEIVAPDGEAVPPVVAVEIEDQSLPVLVAVEAETLPVAFVMKEVNYTNQQLYCLAVNIYFEARSESAQGMLAVGLVTLNRVKSKRYPSTICKVVWQRKQFSWTHDGLSDTPRNRRAWKMSQAIARMVIEDYIVASYDFTKGALWYHANYVSPTWSKKGKPTTTIGAHIFYAKL